MSGGQFGNPDDPVDARRRRFLQAAGALAVAPVVPSQPMFTPAPSLVQPALLLPDAEVAGLSYQKAIAAVIDTLTTSMRVQLVRDRSNGYDANAIAIHVPGGERIGWVPRTLNTPLAALMDAGHSLVGEITGVDRRDFETRLSGDGKPFAGRVILEELEQDSDGARRVRMADLRLRFRAWLATGLAPDAPLPDPDDIPGQPGWKRIVSEFEAQLYHWEALRPHAGELVANCVMDAQDMRPRLGDPEPRYLLVLPSGNTIGVIAGEPARCLAWARQNDLSAKLVITRVRYFDENDSDAFRSPRFEIHANGRPPPYPYPNWPYPAAPERPASPGAAPTLAGREEAGGPIPPPDRVRHTTWRWPGWSIGVCSPASDSIRRLAARYPILIHDRLIRLARFIASQPTILTTEIVTRRHACYWFDGADVFRLLPCPDQVNPSVRLYVDVEEPIGELDMLEAVSLMREGNERRAWRYWMDVRGTGDEHLARDVIEKISKMA
ncbi:MAG: HIRAN domain-containing protein [Hyphomicrobiaceae bacterium]|nr:HIRAN domain-containing protein [Hyphomicrobiaceae bacterium]